MEREVVINRALEEFRERLLRWDELCAQLRELYYKYLDLAAFRSEKCYFPGRKCKRPWGREYDVGDLTLMWTYIANTAPLCGKLIRALARVEYEIRKRALESLKMYGGELKKSRPQNEVIYWRLKEPVYAYVIVDKERLYVIWGEPEGIPRSGRQRSVMLERAILNILTKIKGDVFNGLQINIFDIDDEYKRLWINIPLPKASASLIGKENVPVVLFRAIGWILSDDNRDRVYHGASNVGQIALRIYEYISLIRYAVEVLRLESDKPVVFKLSVYNVTKSKKYDKSVKVDIEPLTTAATIIRKVYRHFGIQLKPASALLKGYNLLKSLKDEAFRKEGGRYVVADIGAWIAFSNIVGTLVLGDGYLTDEWFAITVKTVINGLETKIKLSDELAEAIGGHVIKGHEVRTKEWHVRLILPIAATPAFEKSVKLYRLLSDSPVAVLISGRDWTYLLYKRSVDQYMVYGRKAEEVAKRLRELGIDVQVEDNMLKVSTSLLKLLPKYGVSIKFLNELEKEKYSVVKPILPSPDPDTVMEKLREIIAGMRIRTFINNGKECVELKLPKGLDINEVKKKLLELGINSSVHSRVTLRICGQNGVSMIKKTVNSFFTPSPFF